MLGQVKQVYFDSIYLCLFAKLDEIFLIEAAQGGSDLLRSMLCRPRRFTEQHLLRAAVEPIFVPVGHAFSFREKQEDE